MNEDMSNMINKINNMIKNNEIPDEIKNIVNQFNSSNDNSNNKCNDQDISSSSYTETDFDINTILKIKKMMDSINSNKDDYRANLLRSLKPYLKPSRKEKVEQYIQFLNIEKMLGMFNSLGGDSKK